MAARGPYPIAPLAQLAGCDLSAIDGSGVARLAADLGIDRSGVKRAKRNGLTDRQADSWAIRIGWHPALIWPDWLDDAV